MPSKKELYAQLAEKIKSFKKGSSYEDLQKFANEHELILLSDYIGTHGDIEFSIPTDIQIEENWTSSNIGCGYKPDEDISTTWYDSSWSSSS